MWKKKWKKNLKSVTQQRTYPERVKSDGDKMWIEENNRDKNSDIRMYQ